MQKILFAHISSDEFGMPFWLKWHVPMFDHGVLLSYDTNDATLDIIRELAPTWEIRHRCRSLFTEPRNSKELLEIEREFNGWKIILNVTEFLFVNDFDRYLSNLNKKAIRGNGVVMVDSLNDIDKKIDFNEHLLAQKTYGYFEEDLLHIPNSTECKYRSRSRVLHCYEDSKHCVFGRHWNEHTDEIDESLFICWFGWSPVRYVWERRKLLGKTILENIERFCANDEQWKNVSLRYMKWYIDILDENIYYNCFKKESDRS